ncbi:PrsW family glutamic-type intramembrane protease [Actinoplanes sp. NPDC051633]|uniref:PrsW family glutamic-type intramembrane protease n=1 Tax=Actinoplanes sp. NPDC051633 TaxID=3155670 RepID=UPI0034237D56
MAEEASQSAPHPDSAVPSSDSAAPYSGPGAYPAGPDGSGVAVADGGVPMGGAPVGGAPARKVGWRRWLPLAGVISFIAACSIAMLLILGFSNGIAGLIIGLVAAILPVPVLVGCFLWLDRYEPEPNRYLVFCFAWGASVATLVAIGVNTGGAWLFDRLGLPDALVAVLIAPFIEETMKALGPILLLWRRRREWSGITDGIVYCGLSAIGFAMVENVLYLGGHGYAQGADQYGPATGIQNVFLIFIVRILFTGFAHPLFTAMTGVGLGLASRSGDRRVKWLAPIAGLLLAMILHGTFNALPTLSAATGESMIMLYGYLGFMVPFFFATVGFAIALRGWEGRLSERVLPHYVRAGWFAPPEVASLSSLGRRHSARRWAQRVAGDAGMKAMRGFQFASTRLAIVRDGMQRGVNRKPQDQALAAEEEQRLLAEIVGYRAVFTGRDPQMPRAFWNGNDYQVTFPDGTTRRVNAPPEPVMPVPVRLAPQPAMAGYGYGPSPYGPYGGAAPGYGPPGYGGPGAGYGPPPALSPYGPGYPTGGPAYGAPGYGAPSYGAAGHGYGSPAQQPAQPSFYPQAAGHPQQPAATPGSPPQDPTAVTPTSAAPPSGFQQPPAYPPPDFPRPSVPAPPGYEQPPAAAPQPAFGTPQPPHAGQQPMPDARSEWSATGSPWGEAPATRPFSATPPASPDRGPAGATPAWPPPEPEPETRPFSAPPQSSPGWASGYEAEARRSSDPAGETRALPFGSAGAHPARPATPDEEPETPAPDDGPNSGPQR